jgi:hypothetical protein
MKTIVKVIAGIILVGAGVGATFAGYKHFKG